MAEPPPMSAADAQALLRYAQVTYAAVTDHRRRLARLLLGITVVFAAAALVCAVQAYSTLQRVEQVVDDPLVEALGVEIPDPRPALERAELRLRAFGWGVTGGACGLVALLTGALHLLLRPTPLPADLRALGAPARGQPPM